VPEFREVAPGRWASCHLIHSADSPMQELQITKREQKENEETRRDEETTDD